MIEPQTEPMTTPATMPKEESSPHVMGLHQVYEGVVPTPDNHSATGVIYLLKRSPTTP
jgi:hypothetical protein